MQIIHEPDGDITFLDEREKERCPRENDEIAFQREDTEDSTKAKVWGFIDGE